MAYDEEELFSADGVGLLLCGVKVFFLADVGHEGDNFVAFVDEPREDARRVQSARVRQ